MSNITRGCLDFCDLACPPKPCPYPLQCAKPRSQNIQPVPSCTCSSLNGAPTDSGTLKSDPGIFLSAERTQKIKFPQITNKNRDEPLQVLALGRRARFTRLSDHAHLAQVKWRSIGLCTSRGFLEAEASRLGCLVLSWRWILLVLRCLCEKGSQTQIPSSTGSFKPMKLSKGPPVSPHARGHVKFNTELKCLNRQHTLRGAGNSNTPLELEVLLHDAARHAVGAKTGNPTHWHGELDQRKGVVVLVLALVPLKQNPLAYTLVRAQHTAPLSVVFFLGHVSAFRRLPSPPPALRLHGLASLAWNSDCVEKIPLPILMSNWLWGNRFLSLCGNEDHERHQSEQKERTACPLSKHHMVSQLLFFWKRAWPIWGNTPLWQKLSHASHDPIQTTTDQHDFHMRWLLKIRSLFPSTSVWFTPPSKVPAPSLPIFPTGYQLKHRHLT